MPRTNHPDTEVEQDARIQRQLLIKIKAYSTELSPWPTGTVEQDVLCTRRVCNPSSEHRPDSRIYLLSSIMPLVDIISS
jgi:hypothetical protein